MSRDGHIEDLYGQPCWCGDTHNWSGRLPEPLPTEAELDAWAEATLAEMEIERKGRSTGGGFA